jgi:hypothetical protein
MNFGAWLLLWIKISGIATVLVGCGYLGSMAADAAGRGKSRLAHTLRLFEFGIVGLGLVSVLAVAISLFAPLGDAAHCTFVLLGAVGIVWMSRRSLRFSRPDWRDCVWAAVLTAFVTYGTAHAPLGYDAGLYHLQAISYFHQGALPLGIANIHTRLGFNSSWFPVSALCAGPLVGREGVFLLNAAATVIFLGAFVSSVSEGWRSSKFGVARGYAAAALLLFLPSGVLFAEWFGLSPSPDLPSALSCAYAFFAFLAVAGMSTERPAPKLEVGRYLVLLVSSATLAATAKTSQAPVLLLVAPWWCPQGIRAIKRQSLWEYKTALFLGGLVVGAWVVQGLIASGCLAFPGGFSCLRFLPWTVDVSKANLIFDILRTWNKAPFMPIAQVPGGLAWIPIWRDRVLKVREFVFILAWVAAGLQLIGSIAIIGGRRAKAKSPVSAATGLAWTFGPAVAVSVSGIIYWFFGAPDPRFALGFLVALPSLTFGLMAAWSLREDAAGLGRIYILLFASLIVLALGVQCYTVYRDKKPLTVWRHEPQPSIRSVMTAAGLTVRIPVGGDQCWDARPPCTPEPPDALHQSTMFGHLMYFHAEPTVLSTKLPQNAR